MEQMTNTTFELKALVQACKGVSPVGKGCSILVYNNDERTVGAICAIDPATAADPVLLEKMTLWRNLNTSWFFSQFTPTAERTQRWLETMILTDPTRIMFLVEDVDGRRLGQYGLCSISPHEAQLDNGIRGEAGGHPRLFYFVELTIIHFCFTCLGVQRVFTRLFSNNVMAMRLHKSVGLSVEIIQFLKKTDHLDEVRFESVPNESHSNTDIKSYTLHVDRSSFYQRYPALKNKEIPIKYFDCLQQ